jgi:hypothetical protein
MMTDTVHFSEDEILDILDASRLRSAVTRDKGPGYDRVDLTIPLSGERSYRLERDAVGCTYLIVAPPDDLHLMACGTLAECLGFYR